MNIRIGFYIEDLSRLGGAERVTLNLIMLLQKKYIVTDIISLFQEKDLIEKYSFLKIHILKKMNTYEIANILNKNNITHLIVQVQNLEHGYIVSKIAKDMCCKVFPILHSSPYIYLKKYGLPSEKFSSIRKILQYLKMQLYWKKKNFSLFNSFLNDIGRIYCVSEQAMIELQKILSDNFNKCFIDYIYNPLSFKLMDYQCQKENILLFAGRLSFEKQPLKLLKIWKLIQYKHPNWHFYILGDGPLKKKMTNYIRKHEVHNVVMLGSVSNVDEYLKKSKIVLLSSYYEGLPTILLEASIYKNALISYTGDGGTADIVKNGVNGYLIEDSSLYTFAEALSRMMENESLTRIMGETSNKLLYSKFSDEEILKKWDNLLKHDLLN